MLNLSTKKMLEIIAGVSILLSVLVLIKLGLDMHLVTEWRVNGERAKANMFLLGRGTLVFFLTAISFIATHISDTLEASSKALQKV